MRRLICPQQTRTFFLTKIDELLQVFSYAKSPDPFISHVFLFLADEEIEKAGTGVPLVI